jgi:hypothetical protein
MIGILNTVLRDFCLSVALQTFYRKSFSTTILPQFLCFLTLGIFPPLPFDSGKSAFIFLATVRGPLTCFAIYKWIWRKNIKSYNLLLVLVVVMEIDFYPLLHSPEWAIGAQLVVSLTQFIRKPLSLKNKIREIRVFLGPVYVLYSVRSFYLVHRTFGSAYPSLGALMFANAALASVGGVLFRPDNDILLKHLGWKTYQQDRRLRHRNCMILSALTSLTCFLYIWIWIWLQYGKLKLIYNFSELNQLFVNVCELIENCNKWSRWWELNTNYHELERQRCTLYIYDNSFSVAVNFKVVKYYQITIFNETIIY